MAEQAYAYVTLIPVAKGFQAKIASEMAGVGGVGGKSGKEFSKGFGGAIKGLIGPALFAGASAAVTGFTKSAISQASNLEESLNAVNVSFGASAEGIKALGKEAALSLGISNAEFNKAAVGFSSFAGTIAGPGGDVTKIIDDLTTRGADFASVMNLEVSDALGKFRAGLSGEAEPLKQFGINVSEANVKAFAMANGIGALGAELTETEKIQARYGFIMQETSKMQGDFANTSDGLANGMRQLKSSFADVQAEVGTALLPVMAQLTQALIPIAKEIAPVLTQILQALAPVFTVLTANIGPLIDSLMPLVDAFALFIEAGGEILAAILPPMVEIIGALTPIVASLAKAFLPIIKAILPPLIKLIEALLPFIEMFGTLLAQYILPLLGKLIEAILPVLIPFIDAFTWGLTQLNNILGPVFAALKPVADTLMAIAGIKPADLNKTIRVTTVTDPNSNMPTGADARERWLAAQAGGLLTPTPTPTPTPTGAAAGPNPASVIRDAIRNARRAIRDARRDYAKEIEKANKDFAERSAEISENYSMAIAKASISRDASLAKALKENAQRVSDIQADFAKRLDDIIKQSMQRLRDVYRSAVEINVASIFDGDVVAGSIDGTIELMRRKLADSRQLLANAAALSAAGFSQTFIEQIVGAGTEVGNEMAKAILNSSPEQQSEMRQLFNDIEKQASSGMDELSETIYEKNGLATQGLRDLYAQTQNELVVSLAAQEKLYQETMTEIMATFDQAVIDAAIARDNALLEAEKTLQSALLAANENFVEQMKTIRRAFRDQITDMQQMVSGMSAQIAGLMSQIANAQSAAAKAAADAKAALNPPKTGATSTQVPFAKGGLVTGPTNALIGEAGPELVIPLDRFESWMNMGAGGSGKAINYYAAPNQSLDSETELFNAMKRAKVVVGW